MLQLRVLMVQLKITPVATKKDTACCSWGSQVLQQRHTTAKLENNKNWLLYRYLRVPPLWLQTSWRQDYRLRGSWVHPLSWAHQNHSKLLNNHWFKKDWNPFKKRYSTSNDIRRNHENAGGHDIAKSYHIIQEGKPQTGKQLYCRNSLTVARALSPVQAPQPRGLASGGAAARALSFEGQQGLSARAPRDWGIRTPPSEGSQKDPCALGPREKAVTPRRLGQTYLLWKVF